MDYLLAPFHWGSAVVHAVCSEVSVWVINLGLWMELHLGCWKSWCDTDWTTPLCAMTQFLWPRQTIQGWEVIWLPGMHRLYLCHLQVLWKISLVPGMRSEFPLCASWCNPSLRTVLTGEICERGSSSWSFISFFRYVSRLCDLELNTNTLFTASA